MEFKKVALMKTAVSFVAVPAARPQAAVVLCIAMVAARSMMQTVLTAVMPARVLMVGVEAIAALPPPAAAARARMVRRATTSTFAQHKLDVVAHGTRCGDTHRRDGTLPLLNRCASCGLCGSPKSLSWSKVGKPKKCLNTSEFQVHNLSSYVIYVGCMYFNLRRLRSALCI